MSSLCYSFLRRTRKYTCFQLVPPLLSVTHMSSSHSMIYRHIAWPPHACVCGEWGEVISVEWTVWIQWRVGTTWKPKLWESATGAGTQKSLLGQEWYLAETELHCLPPPGHWQRLKYIAMSIPIPQVRSCASFLYSISGTSSDWCGHPVE